VCDDYAGYKALLTKGVLECGCLAHARRKLFDLHAHNPSQLAEQALKYFAQLYAIEREGHELDAHARCEIRQAQAKPIADALHAWMAAHRAKVPDESAIAKALDYSLTRWIALTRCLEDGTLPPDNNHVENQIRPAALGRAN
jgi:hypothetical protein